MAVELFSGRIYDAASSKIGEVSVVRVYILGTASNVPALLFRCEFSIGVAKQCNVHFLALSWWDKFHLAIATLLNRRYERATSLDLIPSGVVSVDAYTADAAISRASVKAMYSGAFCRDALTQLRDVALVAVSSD